MNLDGIKNLIFDLGNVLIDINPDLSTTAFKKLGVSEIDAFYSLSKQNSLFDNLETGKISNANFRNEIRAASNQNLTDEQIDDAWNALLLEMPNDRLNLLSELGKTYKIFLLSNTNDIHITSFNKTLEAEGRKDTFYNLFDYAYLSHKVGLRKPGVEIYQHLLDEQSIAAEETLFLDDLQNNLDGAAKLNIRTQLVYRNIVDLFDL